MWLLCRWILIIMIRQNLPMKSARQSISTIQTPLIGNYSLKQVNELREGRAVEQPTYSYILSNRLPETIQVEPKPVIIVEGIMALSNKRLRDMMDLKIFVDCDPDERLIRNIQRDTIDRGRTVSMVVERYLEVLKPMHEQFIEPTKRYADVIIPQGGENVKGINILCKYIEGLMPEE